MTRKAFALMTATRRLQQATEGAAAPMRVRPSSRIMYIECKSGGLIGSARIGRVTFSRTGCTLYYRNQQFQSLKGAGFKSNYVDVETGVDYWISGPKGDGSDRLYGERPPSRSTKMSARSIGETFGAYPPKPVQKSPKTVPQQTTSL